MRMMRDDQLATRMAAFITRTLDEHGMLACEAGGKKTVNTCTALKSSAHLLEGGAGVTGTAAARLGRQAAHADAPQPTRGSIDDLAPGDRPLSVMVAMEPGTQLWVFPSGCNNLEDALLVELQVGDVLVWRGDVIHAGAGRPHTRLSAPSAPRRWC